MKTNTLAVVLGLAAIAFAACSQQPAANSASNSTVATTNRNSMGNSNATPANANHDMSDMHHSGMMNSDPNAASQPYDLQFIDTMSAHHQSAVDMAEMAIKKTQNPELKKFAQKIIDDQKKEIAQMKEWRDKWYAGKPASKNMEMSGMADSMKMMMGDEMKHLEGATGKDFDVDFLDMMTPHHTGAIVMAREALTKAEHPEIKTLANQIIKAQEAEIKQMADWKSKWSK